MKKPKKLMFSSAGIPRNAKGGDTLEGIRAVRNLGLDAMELEFVRRINISKEKAPEVKRQAEKHNVFLTCHAPYYINLNAKEKQKVYASMYRIEKSAETLYMCGGWSVCFHPGHYLKMEKDTVYENIKKRIKEVREKLDEKGVDVWIRPETTGKRTQFGNLNELLRISQEVDGVMPVIDFSHLHARTNGKYNSKKEFKEVLELTEKSLGREGLDNMHLHVSGIEYGEKGEKNHVNLQESDMKYEDLLKVWKEFNIKGSVVCESPNIEEDAMMLQKIYNKI